MIIKNISSFNSENTAFLHNQRPDKENVKQLKYFPKTQNLFLLRQIILKVKENIL